MKLGTQTGSYFNHLMSNNQTQPEVGKGATVLLWTDRNAYEVMEVSKDGKKVVMQRYNSKRTDKLGMSDSQDYEYKELNGVNEIVVFRNGGWKRELKGIEFTKEFGDELLNRRMTEEERKELFNENGDLTVIEGKTKEVKRYEKINVIWGVKREYYDYSF